ncbi:MAG: hypothetical protein NC122_07530 [Faecalibacterium sp.]|nr:hypothetical protein [Ruminococcus sp.]MCM1392332.1 hypothetical protein [Ruminococcus sp.]MCM1486043.1 hypothetical protein [Faecalibacterium sp.]
MSKFKGLFSGPDSELAKGICIALVIVILFTSGYTVGMFRGGANKTVSADTTTSAAATPDTTVDTTPAPAPAPTPDTTPSPAPAPSDSTPASSEQAQPSASDSAVAPSESAVANAGASTGAPQTPAEIIALFNESANKVKTNATRVTRNYEDLTHNEENTVMPSALESIGKGLISTFLKKDETPVVSEGADIANGFPVKGESWGSKATEADVTEATCTDDGTSYNITLKFKESTDPAVGSGVGATFDIMKQEDITNAASIVQSASTRYYDAVVTCKIDKATGNMTWANYKLPMVLSVTAKVLVTLDAAVGMTFEHDYTIEY